MNPIHEILSACGEGVHVRALVSLAPFSTFGIGGPCDYLLEPSSQEGMIRAIGILRQRGIPYRVLGRCSNVVFADAGFRGAIILTGRMHTVELRRPSEIYAEAGASLIGLSQMAASASLAGLTFACGIPGSVGGALRMNAGAHGGEMKDVVLSSQYLDANGNVKTRNDHRFSYRHSIYQEEKDSLILSVTFRLQPGDKDEILQQMRASKEKRLATQPVKEKSAGSVFRRQEGCIPARLIDEAGLKGLSVGGAAVSEKHAGFIVNRNNATADDVRTLVDKIRSVIFERHGIDLVPEIEFIEEV